MKSFKHNRIHLIEYGKIPITNLIYSDKEYAKSENIYMIIGAIGEILDRYIDTNSKRHKKISIGDSDMSDEMSAGDSDVVVNMEGISYGSTGSAALADLAGLNFAIRMLLLSRNISFKIVSPISLKLFATNNAGASKEEMSWAWKLLDPEVRDVDKIKIDDLADAYFLCRYGSD